MQQHPHQSFKETLQIFLTVCTAVAELHHGFKPAIIHRDIKMENVLVDAQQRFKLCDLGSATQHAFAPRTGKEIAAAEEDIAKHTTAAYRAPEQIDGLFSSQFLGPKVDVWALGVLLYMMLFDQRHPFSDSGGRFSSQSVEFDWPASPNTPKSAHTLCSQLFTPNVDRCVCT
jgi:serine/threonine protein kinase